MLHCRYQGLQLLRLGADALGAQVGMARYGTIQQRLLLTMSRICHGQTLETALCLSCRHIKDKVSILYPISGLCAVINAAILTRAIAHATHLTIAMERRNQ